MSASAVITRGYSISGGFQAGTALLPRLGFGSGAVTPGVSETFHCGRAGIARLSLGHAGTTVAYVGAAGVVKAYPGKAGTNPC